MEIKARNVNGALAQALDRLAGLELMHGAEQDSRNGPVLEWGEPVLTIYEQPCERVLFWPARDANPFFHFFEGLWIIRGCQDVDFVAQFVPRMRDYSDDGFTLRGAYGDRARVRNGDQIANVITLLQTEPHTRRAVLGLWDAADHSYTLSSKDIPCNTHLYFLLRNGALDMTITNRSNDILWGAYGANAVHFSMLQEYIANKINRPVGRMFQFSNNWHVYTTGPGGELYRKLQDNPPLADSFVGVPPDPYARARVCVHPMKAHLPDWDKDLTTLFRYDFDFSKPVRGTYSTGFFRDVVTPFREAWRTRSVSKAMEIVADDWRVAAVQWLERRNHAE